MSWQGIANLTFMNPTLNPLVSWRDRAGPRMKFGNTVTRSNPCSLAILQASLSADACTLTVQNTSAETQPPHAKYYTDAVISSSDVG